MPMNFHPKDRPRIIEIEDPAGGQYLVGVEVDPKFLEVGTCPAFGVTIDTVIDASYLDARYSGMVFVDVRPGEKDKKGKFLLIFRKLPGTLLEGQDYDEILGVPVEYTEQLVAAGTGLGSAGTWVSPISTAISKNRVQGISARKDALLALYFQTADLADVSLPDTLLSLEIIWGGSTGEGSSSGGPVAGVWGLYPPGGFTIRIGHESSHSIDGDVHMRMRRGFRGPAVAVNHLFFLDKALASMDHVKARIAAELGAAVYDWPVVHEEVATLVLISESKQQRSGSSESWDRVAYAAPNGIPNWTMAKVAQSTEASHSVGANARIVTIPDCIHSAIVIAETTLGTPGSALGKFWPPVLPATTPTSVSQGIYLRSMDIAPHAAGTVRVSAQTVDLTRYV